LADDFKGFVENAWVGRIVAIGGNVRLKIDLKFVDGVADSRRSVN
jgi:hypothetical protein